MVTKWNKAAMARDGETWQPIKGYQVPWDTSLQKNDALRKFTSDEVGWYSTRKMIKNNHLSVMFQIVLLRFSL